MPRSKTASVTSSAASQSDKAGADKGVTDRDDTYAEMEARLQTQALFEAIYAENELDVKRLVRKDDVNTNVVDESDPTHPTPLIAAVQKENIEIIKYLLKSKKHPAHVNKEDRRGKRAIW